MESGREYVKGFLFRWLSLRTHLNMMSADILSCLCTRCFAFFHYNCHRNFFRPPSWKELECVTESVWGELTKPNFIKLCLFFSQMMCWEFHELTFCNISGLRNDIRLERCSDSYKIIQEFDIKLIKTVKSGPLIFWPYHRQATKSLCSPVTRYYPLLICVRIKSVRLINRPKLLYR